MSGSVEMDRLKVKEAADVLGCSCGKIYMMIKAGEIQCQKISKKIFYIPRSEVDRILKESLQVPAVEVDHE